MATNNANFGQPWIKRGGELQKSADSMYKSSFRDLPDGTIYRDPLGMRAGTEVRLQEKMYDARANEALPELDGMSVLEYFDHKQDRGFSISDTVDEIRKNLDTGDYSIPIDYIPDVFVVNPERTPMAEFLARETTQSDVVKPTAVTDDPSPSWGLEDTTDSENNYSYADPTYDDTLSYDVLGFGFATRIEDKMMMASQPLRNAEATQQQSLLRGMRQELERQIILGSNNNASGFDGFDDLGTVDSDMGDPTSVSDYEEEFRDLKSEVEYQGAPAESVAFVTDFTTYEEAKNDIVSNVRYSDPMDELSAGFETFTVDGSPVFKSHAITRTEDLSSGTTNNTLYAINMEATYLSMLQETSVKPLAKLGPQEQFGVDAYGTLVDESAGNHIQIKTVTTPA